MSGQVVDKAHLFEDFRLITTQIQAQKNGITTDGNWLVLTGKYRLSLLPEVGKRRMMMHRNSNLL